MYRAESVHASNYSSDKHWAAHRTGGIAVLHCAAAHASNYSSNVVPAADRAGGIAVLHCAIVRIAGYDTDMVTAADRAGGRTVFHGAAVLHISGCAADKVIAADRAGEAAVFHRAVVETAEQPGAIQQRVVDIQTGHGMAPAVERAFEGNVICVTVSADGHPALAAVVILSISGQVEVTGKLISCAVIGCVFGVH